MSKSLTFIFIVFMMAKFYFKKFCFKKHRMTSPHKIVINVDIGMLLTWNFQKTFKTKFGSLKNCGRPKACRNFSILKEKFWPGKIYPPPWGIGLKILCRIWLSGKCFFRILEILYPHWFLSFFESGG